MLRRSLYLFSIITLLLPAIAHAHQPFFNDLGSPQRDAAYVIAEPSVSKALFGALRIPGSVDYYRLDIVDRLDLSVRLLVPDSPACAGFNPQLALIGGDVVATGDATGLDVSGNLQATAIETQTWGAWSGHGLGPQREGAELRAQLTAGTYYLAVRDTSGATGSYLLSLAGSEQFGGDPDAGNRMRLWERCADGKIAQGTVAPQPQAPPVAPTSAAWVARWVLWIMRLAGVLPVVWLPSARSL